MNLSNGGENYVTAPPWQEALKKFKKAIVDLRRVASAPAAPESYTSRR